MADSPLFPIICVSSRNADEKLHSNNGTSSEENQVQFKSESKGKEKNDSQLQRHGVISAEMIRDNYRRQGYWSDIQRDIDEHEISSDEELVEDPSGLCLFLNKTSYKERNTRKNVLVRNPFGYAENLATEHLPPTCKRKFTSIPFARFVIKRAMIVHGDNGYTFISHILIECFCAGGGFSVLLPVSDFNDYKIMKHIESSVNIPVFANNLQYAKINRHMHTYIKQKLNQNNQEYIMVYKPGFYKDCNGACRFVANDTSLKLPVSSLIKFDFEVRSFSGLEAKKYISDYCKLIKNKKMERIALLRFAALLLTPLYHLGYKLSKTIIIYGCKSNEKKESVKTWLKVYNRLTGKDNHFYTLSSLKQSQINSIAYDNKDCFVIFDDNTATSNNKTMPDSEKNKMNLIANLFSFNKNNSKPFTECNCAVISDRYMVQDPLSDEAFLFYDCSGIATEELENINRICYKFDQVTVDFIKSLFEKFKDSLMPFREGNAKQFIYNSSYKAYMTLSVCISIFRKMCSTFECDELSDEDFQEWNDEVKKIILNSERFNNNDYMINEFAEELSLQVNQEKIVLVNDSDVHNQTASDNQKAVYVNEESGMLLIRSNLLKEIIRNIPAFTADKEAAHLKQMLAERNLLSSNSGDKRYLYRTGVCGSPKREYFVAIMCDLLNDEAKKRMPVSETNYQPLIDTSDGIERIKLGYSDDGNPVYWSVGADLMNKHLFVRGKTGSGKTYFLSGLAKKLHDIGKRVIILDCAAASGYNLNQLSKALSEEYICENITICNRIMTVKETVNSDNIIVMRSSFNEAEEYLAQLMNFCENSASENKETFVIFDEVADLNITRDASLGRAILQGRKNKLNIITATQILCGLGVKEKTSILCESSLHITFPVNKIMRGEIAKEISRKKSEEYEELIKNLKKGQALAYGELEDSTGNICYDKCIKFRVVND